MVMPVAATRPKLGVQAAIFTVSMAMVAEARGMCNMLTLTMRA